LEKFLGDFASARIVEEKIEAYTIVWDLRSDTVPALLRSRRRMAIALSSSVKPLVVNGLSGRQKKRTKDQTTVTEPRTRKSGFQVVSEL
jgi:hypothetical protein